MILDWNLDFGSHLFSLRTTMFVCINSQSHHPVQYCNTSYSWARRTNLISAPSITLRIHPPHYLPRLLGHRILKLRDVPKIDIPKSSKNGAITNTVDGGCWPSVASVRSSS